MDSDDDELREQTNAKLRALWKTPGGPAKVQRLFALEAKKRASEREEANRLVLMAVFRQSLKIQTLTEQAILNAKAPEKYRRLTYLEAKRRGLMPPRQSS